MPIEDLIYPIRGYQVMLDCDLAQLYGVETKRLKEQVRRNIVRFPEDFMFELTEIECTCLRSQFATSNNELHRGGNRYTPFAFTEQGIAMLSGVLRSNIAIEVNIKIMRAFTAVRRFMLNNAHIFQRVESLEVKQLHTEEKVDAILDRLNAGELAKEGVFFDGQIFDAYQFVCDLVRIAKHRIVLIDNYVDETVLSLLAKRKKGVTATIYTQKIPNTLALDLKRHNAQYSPIEIAEVQGVHDRFLIIDDVVYHIGASIKDLGKKLFAFNRMEMKANILLDRVK